MAVLLQLLFLFLFTQTLAQTPSQVCLLVPPETDACYKELQGTLVTERAAQVNCLQKLLWNFQENVTMTGNRIKILYISRFKSLNSKLFHKLQV